MKQASKNRFPYAPLIVAAIVIASQDAVAADAQKGKAIFSRCAVCHSATKDGPNGVGPNLFGIVGRKAGTKVGFSYSNAMKTSGITWTADKLDAYVTHPTQVVPGNRMAFAGLPDATQRADLIAFLETLK